jgi:DNA recombination protein RmuC
MGEIQLGSILEQILSASQFESQKAVKEGSQERVDYVIKLPDKNSMDKVLLLPIDSKFPTEDYQRLLDAYDAGLTESDMKSVSSSFEYSVKKSAKDIHDKYINPPTTTDFAVMFVPTEGLYAEIVRRADLFESLQRLYKVTVVGPTNLAAFLSSLQMGFRTLAIERRSNEVWELLGAVKTEFGKYGDLMENIKRKIDSAAKEIDTVGVRSRAIERKLRSVEEMPTDQSSLLLDGSTEYDG